MWKKKREKRLVNALRQCLVSIAEKKLAGFKALPTSSSALGIT